MFISLRATLLSALALSGCSGTDLQTSEVSNEALAQAKGAILRADGSSALELISEASAGTLSNDDQAFVSCATKRITGQNSELPSDVSSPFAKDVLQAFQTYWREAITDQDSRDLAARKLEVRLLEILQINDSELIEQTIIERLRSEGLYSLMGRTGRLQELMIWRDQREDVQTVKLPDGQVTATVYYLDQFVSTGWSGYFACDTVGTAGWAKDDGLYVVVPRWPDLESERFQISFLMHEGQHFQDYSRFPELSGWELEYRAKLVELSLAVADQNRLIERFSANQGDDTSDAHSYANKKVLRDIRAHLNLEADAPLHFDTEETIQKAAAALLKLDTELHMRRSDAEQ